MKYRIWQDDEDWDRWARLARKPDELQEMGFMLSFGEPAANDMPSEVTFDINPEFGIELADSIPNSCNVTVVSERLRSLLASTDSEMELFPTRLRNPRGRVESAPYFILNVLTRHRCVDMERSEYIPAFQPGQISDLLKPVLIESQIGTPNQVFRIGEAPRLVMVHEDLCKRIEDAGMTGVRFVAVEDYNKAWR